jgi:hypothetical protein
MRASISRDSLRVKICLKLARIIDKWWARFVIGPLLVTAPPSLVFGFYQYTGLHSSLPQAIVKYMLSNQPVAMILAVVYLYLLTVFYGVIQGCSKDKQEIDTIDKSGISFKVTIASIENDLPVEWFYYTPPSAPPKTSIDVLQNPNSSICKAIQTRKMVIVEDFRNDVAKGIDSCYVVSDERDILMKAL